MEKLTNNLSEGQDCDRLRRSFSTNSIL